MENNNLSKFGRLPVRQHFNGPLLLDAVRATIFQLFLHVRFGQVLVHICHINDVFFFPLVVHFLLLLIDRFRWHYTITVRPSHRLAECFQFIVLLLLRHRLTV